MFGILNVYKPKGMTSHDVVSFIRKIFHMKRVGHTGTLDPDAEGVLPILIGKATKLSDLLMSEEKRYAAHVRLGVITDTDDLSGAVLETRSVAVDEATLKETVRNFVGETEQIPPMYSAVKVNGQKLYNLARKGIITERKPRKITIFSAEVSEFDGTFFKLSVHCSKGTYIRALCRDIGERLGTGAAMVSLLRSQSGSFCVSRSYTLEEIEQAAKNNTVEKLLISPDSVLSHLKTVEVGDVNTEKIKCGIRLRPQQLGIDEFYEHELFRIRSHGELLCILKIVKDENQFVLTMEKSFY